MEKVSIPIDDQEFEEELHQAFTDYLDTERCDLVNLAIRCKEDNLHRQDVENVLAKYCSTEEAVALSFILLDVHSTYVVKKLNNRFESEQKQVEELKHMLELERGRKNDLQQNLELQQRQLHSKDLDICNLEAKVKSCYAELEDLRNKASQLDSKTNEIFELTCKHSSEQQ